MEIEESEILKGGCLNEQKALAILLACNVCELGDYNAGTVGNPIWATSILVDCSDVFMWACSDCDYISNSDGEEDSEILSLYKLWKENIKYGAVRWSCLKRNEQPQKPLQDMMKKDGYWDEHLESLPPNQYDAISKRMHEEKKAK